MINIGNRLKTKRVECGFTRSSVANAAKVTDATISYWESDGGEEMSAVSVFKISEHLKINPFWLITGMGTAIAKNSCYSCQNNYVDLYDKGISEESISLSRQIDQLNKQQRDFITRIISVMHFESDRL